MGRRLARNGSNNDKFTVTRKALDDIRSKERSETVDEMMTCFAIMMARKENYGQKRIIDRLKYIDELMKPIVDGEMTFDDLKRELEEEVGIKIR